MIEFWLARYVTRTSKRTDIQKTADEFAVYQRRSAEISRSFQIEALWADVKVGLPIYVEAREGLMNVPAPHQAALLVKIEVAAESLDNRHAEIVLADARRLLRDRAA